MAWTCPVKVSHRVKAEDLFLYRISLRGSCHRNHCVFISWHNTGSGVRRTKPFVLIYILFFLSRQLHQRACLHQQKGQMPPPTEGSTVTDVVVWREEARQTDIWCVSILCKMLIRYLLLQGEPGDPSSPSSALTRWGLCLACLAPQSFASLPTPPLNSAGRPQECPGGDARYLCSLSGKHPVSPPWTAWTSAAKSCNAKAHSPVCVTRGYICTLAQLYLFLHGEEGQEPFHHMSLVKGRGTRGWEHRGSLPRLGACTRGGGLCFEGGLVLSLCPVHLLRGPLQSTNMAPTPWVPWG